MKMNEKWLHLPFASFAFETLLKLSQFSGDCRFQLEQKLSLLCLEKFFNVNLL